jgi:hypothetical protein
VYAPPTDGPLDEIERALVRALLPGLVAEIREELAKERETAESKEPR